MSLYPLKFKTQFKDKIWGGNKIKTVLNKDFSPLPNCGETWEISGVKGNISVVESGTLAGKNLVELIHHFKGELVGEKVFQKFGAEFPLLIKFIDANDDLSIQVHPNDELAKKRHDSFGKTEMWYIFQADKGAVLNAGFAKEVSKEEYIKHVNNNTLNDILNIEQVQEGDVYLMPAGRVHYIGKGILLAEIQQTSDVTYRIYDFDRVDDKGVKRELHTEMAVDAIDYKVYPNYKSKYTPKDNEAVGLAESAYFKTNLLQLTDSITRSYTSIDSFVIYICFDGSYTLDFGIGTIQVKKGECILLPSIFKSVKLIPSPKCKILECWVP
ncbi:MAG: type I phosphomannose isomerase catalytic subunit [Bacteroidota bacterium]|nr:type I phosphomannose isomerase catalytic subunit [Bacteroidota bacterium]